MPINKVSLLTTRLPLFESRGKGKREDVKFSGFFNVSCPPEDRQAEAEEDLCVGNGDFNLEKKNTIMLCIMLRIRIRNRRNHSLLPYRNRKWNAYGSGSRFEA
jgi:hypothetical protein